jgi:type IV pilus assembly protein PilE
MAHSLHRACRGFTLVEAMAVFAIVAIAAGVALPAYRSQLLHARRADAVNALQQLQQAQEQHRQDQGHYAADLGTLHRAERSREGLYTLTLAEVAADRYTAVARPSAGSPQQSDTDCAVLTLQVQRGFATTGPEPRCWNP